MTFRFASGGGSIHLDDKLVAQDPDLKLAKSIFLGNPWAGSRPMYFDDVSVTPIPEPPPRR